MFLLIGLGISWAIAYGIAWFGHHRRWWAAPYHLDAAALGALLLAALGFFWRIIWGGSWMPADGGDLASFLYPVYRFIASSFRQGVLPLWNPHLYAGAPLIGDIQSGLLYPVHAITFLLAHPLTYRTMQWLSILHFWWAGVGMYLLLRLRSWRSDGDQLNRWASLAGALAFMFSDAFITHFGNLNLIAVASWTPWVFWAYVQAIGSEKLALRWSVAGGALLGVATLAGHPQVTLFIVLALGVYTFFEWVAGERSAGDSVVRPRATALRALRLLAHLATCCVVAGLLAAVILLPGLELSRYTGRAGWSYQESVGYSLSPAQWIGLLVPGFFGRGPQFHWGLWPRVEVGYLGVLPLLLALLAVLRGRPRRMWAQVGLAATLFLVALGIYSLPHGWLTALLPGLGQFRAPARLVLVVDLALAVLAAMGLDSLVRPTEEDAVAQRRTFRLTAWATGATFAVGLPLAYYALLTGQDKSPEVFARISVAVIAVAIFAALLVASLGLLAARRFRWAKSRMLGLLAVLIIFLDLASTGAYNDLGAEDPTKGYDHPAIVAFLQSEEGLFRIDARTGIDQIWQPDTALLYGIDDVWGIVNPLVLADVERYWEGTGGRSSLLYDVLNARFVIGRKDIVLDEDKFELAFEGDPQLNVYRNRQARPRAWLVHEAIAVANQEEAWDALHAPGFDPARTVVVEGAAAALAPATGSERAEVISRGPNELVVEVEAAAPAYLVLSEVFYPGWRVSDDAGVERAIQRANYAFRAVAVQPGVTQLRFVYAPRSFQVGAGLSVAMVLALLAGGVVLWGSALRERAYRERQAQSVLHS
jgi:hypothetical protein